MTPVETAAKLATLVIFFSVIGGSIAAWSHWLSKLRSKGANTSSSYVPQATVGFVDVLVTIAVMVVLFFLAALILRNATTSWSEWQSPDTTISQDENAPPPTVARNGELSFLVSSYMSSAQLVCVVIMTAFVSFRTGSRLSKLGWRSGQIVEDIKSGVVCYLMVTPPILLLSSVLQQATQIEYDHPVIEMIRTYPWLLGFAFWQAAIVAPVSEEFLFRVLLLGWFESIHFAKDKAYAFLFGLTTNEPMPREDSTGLFEMMGVASTPAAASLSDEIANPYSPSATVLSVNGCEPVDGCESATGSNVRPPWWPAIVSGCLFGLAHFSYGISWIPLIVFGIVLGRLYQQRQSVLPVIVVHLLFNSTSLIMLGLGVLIPKP